jgi:dolichol-phosphate mannosyltransferase
MLKISGQSLPGWTALISAILLLGGIQILVIGILGLYINVIFRETKKRPIYIINSIIRKNN